MAAIADARTAEHKRSGAGAVGHGAVVIERLREHPMRARAFMNKQHKRRGRELSRPLRLLQCSSGRSSDQHGHGAGAGFSVSVHVAGSQHATVQQAIAGDELNAAVQKGASAENGKNVPQIVTIPVAR